MRDWVKAEQRWEVRDPIKKGEVELYPVNDDGTERVWSWGHETASKQVADLEVRWKDGVPSVFRKVRPQSEGSLPSTLWVKPEYSAVEYGSVLLKGMFGERGFSFPKSIHAVVDCLKVTGVEDGDWVVDLFGGSGTTAHAALRLIDDDIRCRFVLSEVNEYFEAGLLPRVVKAASAQEWEEGGASEIDGPGIFIRVQRLEGYEDTLENLALTPEQGESAALPFDDGPTALRWKLDEEARRLYCAIEHYRSPFAYTLRRAEGAGTAEKVPVDLVESLVWLLGLDVARMWRDPQGVAITGKNRRDESVLVAFRECDVKGSGDWVMRLMAEHSADRVYSNDPADLAFPGADRLEAIEAVFARQFGAA
jgi:adenine-specific DNA-methyltransferase